MGKIVFKNQPKGVATTTKKVTDTKTGNVLSEDHHVEDVSMPGTEGMAMQTATLTAALPYAEVGYAAGFTKGLPNYSSTRVDITLKMPAEVENIDSAYVFAEDWVCSRLQKQYEDL